MLYTRELIDKKLTALSTSPFRARFKLTAKDLDYLKEKGIPTIKKHAEDFISARLAPALPVNDGKQTPFRNHPVFIAQHATATCCRKCLSKWHQIPMGKELNDVEIDYIVTLIISWINKKKQR